MNDVIWNFIYMLARGNENFRPPREHSFSFFQVKMFTGSASVLLTSTSFKVMHKRGRTKQKSDDETREETNEAIESDLVTSWKGSYFRTGDDARHFTML